MLTYLAIFLSISVLIVIFVRRWFVLSGKQSRKVEVKNEETESEVSKKKRLSKDEKEDVGKLFKRGEAMIKAGAVSGPPGRQEFFVAPVYQQLINEGKKIYVAPSPNAWRLGTPEDLDYFLGHYRQRRPLG